MSSKPERAPARHAKREEAVVGFTAESLGAPFILRCGAFLIDYLLIVVVPVTFLLLGRVLGEDGVSLIQGGLNNIGWLVATLIGFVDLILLPIVTGQTVGKMLTGLRILRSDGTPARFSQILLRQTIGYLLVLLTIGLGFFIAAFSRSGRSLHDLISRTVVVHARKRYISP